DPVADPARQALQREGRDVEGPSQRNRLRPGRLTRLGLSPRAGGLLASACPLLATFHPVRLPAAGDRPRDGHLAVGLPITAVACVPLPGTVPLAPGRLPEVMIDERGVLRAPEGQVAAQGEVRLAVKGYPGSQDTRKFSTGRYEAKRPAISPREIHNESSMG